MTYVAFLTWRVNLSEERRLSGFGRRVGYSWPEGMTVHNEYWPASPQVAAIVLGFDADTFDPIQRMVMDWEDLFDVTVYPAITAEAGLAAGAKLKGMAA